MAPSRQRRSQAQFLATVLLLAFQQLIAASSSRSSSSQHLYIGQQTWHPAGISSSGSRPVDNGARCSFSGICDGSDSRHCGPDGLGCVTSAKARKRHIEKAIKCSWRAYKHCAWGADQLAPLSCKPQLCPWVPYNSSMTLLGAADLLWLMGSSMRTEYKEARAWINNVIPFDRDLQADTFTLSMTFIGSLLGLYDLTGDGMYIKKALDLADRTMVAYEASPTGWPWRNVNLRTGVVSGNATNVGEAASPTLEFSRLTYITGDQRYKDAAYQLWHLLDETLEGKWDGLFNTWWNITDGSWLPGPNGTLQATWGGMGDLAYEYMLKTWVLSGGRDEVSLRLYTAAVQGLRKHIVRRTRSGSAWLTDVSWDPQTGKVRHGKYMQHLTCFAGATIALGHMHGINTASHPGEPNDLALAEQIAGGCYEMYRQSPSGLNSHAVDKLTGTHATATEGQGYYDQQPELLESLFYLWRFTGNETYRDWGWQIFRAMRMWTRLPNGAFANLDNPTQPPFTYIDTTQEWWLSETMKYLWLLFSDQEVLPLDRWVVNTEGHPYKALPWASGSRGTSSRPSSSSSMPSTGSGSSSSSRAATAGSGTTGDVLVV